MFFERSSSHPKQQLNKISFGVVFLLLFGFFVCFWVWGGLFFVLVIKCCPHQDSPHSSAAGLEMLI